MSEEATLDEFVEEDNFNQSEWQVRSLGELAEYQNGNAFSKSEWGDEGYPIIRIQNLTGEQDEFNYYNGELDERYTVNSGDTLLSWSATIDVFQWSGPKAGLNQHIFRVDTSEDVNDTFYRFKLEHLLPQLIALSHGSTMQHVRKADLVNVDASIPPLPEQRKIATVLYTVNRAKEAAENVLEQIGKVEQGLQQSLFTGEHLACELKEAPTMGQIPEHWDIKTMGEACNITMGSSPKSEHYNESGDGLPFFQANNEFGLRNPEHDRWCSEPVKTAKSGDSLMTIRGTYVGQMNIADRECCIGRGLAGISAGDELLEEYLYQHLRRRERYVKSIAIGSTFDSVSSGDLENLAIAIPPKHEQEQIADALNSLQERLKLTKEHIGQLNRLKRGLMQDLLSGTVRTTDTNIEVPDEIAQYG